MRVSGDLHLRLSYACAREIGTSIVDLSDRELRLWLNTYGIYYKTVTDENGINRTELLFTDDEKSTFFRLKFL